MQSVLLPRRVETPPHSCSGIEAFARLDNVKLLFLDRPGVETQPAVANSARAIADNITNNAMRRIDAVSRVCGHD